MANNLPRSEFIMTLLHEINEIDFVVKILCLGYSEFHCRLVPVMLCDQYDLEALSLSFYIVFMSEIFIKSFPCCLDHLCHHIAILCLDSTCSYFASSLESSTRISLDNLISLKEELLYQSCGGSL
ncbi:hypothetical protein Tco_0476003 [Tanacetum coccineum]